jgi:hypothetical protein
MRLSDFESMVRRQAAEIPGEFLEGIAEIAVSPRTVPHPERRDIWTLGECIPLPVDDGDPRNFQSRIVLYHGSFQALAHNTENFDWPGESWETLTHEVRHHVEWKARVSGLEAFDQAAEANFARQDGQPFDPGFYRDGVPLGEGVYQVDDDVFLERVVSGKLLETRVRWQGRDYDVTIPPEVAAPVYLTLEGVEDPPPGELVLVLQKKGGWLRLFQRPDISEATVEVRQVSE